jgi:RNA polymerase sigma-70 factor (ECF subfamily)
VIHTVLKGDQEAYGSLVQAYQGRVRGLCLSMLLSREEADDAAQEVFVKAFASLRQYKRNVSFPAWLHRIASNHCLDILRKRKRQKTDSLDGMMDPDDEHARVEFAEKPETPYIKPEDQDNLKLAMQVLETLPEGERQILIMRELDGLHYEEISEALQCSLDAVKARLRRARIHLQEKARHFSKVHSLTEGGH